MSVEFFHYASERYTRGWYWRDEQCEEPMGPFDSRADAEADYREVRQSSSDSGVSK